MFKIMLIKVGGRSENAPKVQEILTEYGNIINTRLGLHQTHDNKSTGLIVLRLELDEESAIKELYEKLDELHNVTVTVVDI
ncbi:MAG: hypothetical protein Q4B63_01340 [Clostridium perfringens]|nr:hypothetical protein [Clostridium perfringens]